jgi:DNA-binding MarR family transcriptional regulator
MELLYRSYEKQPLIIGLIKALGPIPKMVDGFLGTRITNLRAKRLHHFYEELNSGDVELSQDLIDNDTFLHAYFSTVEYVARTRSDEKIKRFAKLLKSWYAEDITIDYFEDYINTFNDLSDREFLILSILFRHEQRNPLVDEPNPMKKAQHHWQQFTEEIQETLSIEPPELAAMLLRMEGKGCFMRLLGYYDSMNTGIGYTTSLFQQIHDIVHQE